MIDNGVHLTGNSYHYNENWRSDKQYFDLGYKSYTIKTAGFVRTRYYANYEK